MTASTCNTTPHLAPPDHGDVAADIEPLLTTRDVMAVIQVDRTTIYRWIKAGRLPAVRIGSLIRYRTTDVLAMLSADNHGAPADPAIEQALHLLAERYTQDARPLCTVCNRRRATAGTTTCEVCDQRREEELASKRRWWNEHGQEWRAERRKAQADG